MKTKSFYLKEIRENEDLTSFQKKVLSVLLDIPKGEVRTYAEIAGKAGSPGASRAVGQALSRNPFAPDVPCHRVISSGGRIGGYSAEGGVNRKKLLLMFEGIDMSMISN